MLDSVSDFLQTIEEFTTNQKPCAANKVVLYPWCSDAKSSNGHPAPAVTLDTWSTIKINWKEFCSTYSNSSNYINEDRHTCYRIHIGVSSKTAKQISSHMYCEHELFVSGHVLQSENPTEIGFFRGIPFFKRVPLDPFNAAISKSIGIPVFVSRGIISGMTIYKVEVDDANAMEAIVALKKLFPRNMQVERPFPYLRGSTLR